MLAARIGPSPHIAAPAFSVAPKPKVQYPAGNGTAQISLMPTSFRRQFAGLVAVFFLASPSHVHASLFHGETLDAIANGISWVVLVIAPIIGVAVFWMVHILPEKIAEKRKHPQAKAIQCVCLLSLCFGGMLWPFAWLWAYTKPVLHKMAYGTDVDESHGHGGDQTIDEKKEIEKLRTRIAELEARTKSGRS